MKIDSSSGKHELNPLKNHRTLNNPASNKPENGSASELLMLKERDILSRSIESLLKMLKPQNKNHKILRGLIQLMLKIPVAGDGLPENGDDTRTLLRVLKQFRELNGEFLQPAIVREQKVIEKVLELSLHRDPEQFIIFSEDETLGRPELRINKDGDFESKEHEEYQLTLRIDFEHLGPVSVLLNRSGEQQNCRIKAATKASRNIIRKAHA